MLVTEISVELTGVVVLLFCGGTQVVDVILVNVDDPWSRYLHGGRNIFASSLFFFISLKTLSIIK